MIFNLFRIFPLKSNRVSLITTKNASFESNLRYIARGLDKRFSSNNEPYECHFIKKDVVSLLNMYRLATSKYIFLTDNFFALAFMHVSKDVKMIQLWHGIGLFKRFGYDCLNENEKKVMLKFSKKIDCVSVSSKNAIDIYSRNFAVPKDRVLPLGIPRTDFYSPEHLNEDFYEKFRKEFEDIHPQLKDKKIVLYAPTFRKNPRFNSIFDFFDIERFCDELGEDYVLCIKLHPNFKKFSNEEYPIDLESLSENPKIVDFTKYKNEQDLMLLCDILIADYSSIMVEYTLLNKPIILFAYDLENYLKNDRGFYFDYKKHVPGRIAYNMDDIINIIKNQDFNLEKTRNFADFQFGNFDANSTNRILDYVLDD